MYARSSNETSNERYKNGGLIWHTEKKLKRKKTIEYSEIQL